MSDELYKQAQEKLVEAHRLIREAGELAKQGQFSLHFGEIGDFIPRVLVDESLRREKAIENLKRDGRYNGHHKVVDDPSVAYAYHFEDNPRTPWDEIPEDEREDAIDAEMESIKEEADVPCEFWEYGGGSEDADQWWHPSRC
jgi:hypothetical protein